MTEPLKTELDAQGIEGNTVETGNNLLAIGYTKGFAWLAVILLIILAAVVLVVLIVGWRFYAEVAAIVPDALKPVLGTGIVVLICVAAYAALKTQLPKRSSSPGGSLVKGGA